MEDFVNTVVGLIKGVKDDLLGRIELLERREVVNGRDGTNGKDADMAVVEELKSQIVLLRSELTQRPEPRDGKDVDMVAVTATIEAAVIKAVGEIPKPQDGKSLTVEDVAPLIASQVATAVSALPVPKDGVGMLSAVIDRSGHLIVTASDGATKDVGVVAGTDVDMADVERLIAGEVGRIDKPKDGAPGVNGVDGVGFDDLSVEYDGERTVAFVFQRGDVKKSFPIKFPFLVYRGIYQPQKSYDIGDTVTYGGHLWHCKDITITPPGDGSKGWQMCVRKGDRGKDGGTTQAPKLPVVGLR